MEKPLISCLMPVRASHGALAAVAIAGFHAQTWSEKELIIVTGGNPAEKSLAENLASRFSCENVQVVSRRAITYQDAYVEALVRARGSYIAFWEDDDMSHPDRLSLAMGLLLPHAGGVNAVVHASSLYYFDETGEVFVTGPGKADWKFHEAVRVSSLIIRRDSLPSFEYNYRCHPLQYLADQFSSSAVRPILINDPGLFVVGVYGDNLRSFETHRRMAAVPAWRCKRLNENAAQVREWLDAYRWNRDSVSVAGCDGIAFTHSVPFSESPVPVLYAEGVEKIEEVPGAEDEKTT